MNVLLWILATIKTERFKKLLPLKVVKASTYLHALYTKKANFFNMLGIWLQALSLFQKRFQMLFYWLCADKKYIK